MRQEETIRREILEQRIDRELEALSEKLFGKKLEDASDEQVYVALLYLVKGLEEATVPNDGDKKIYYISAEFLIGKLLSNNLINLGIYEKVESVEAKDRAYHLIKSLKECIAILGINVVSIRGKGYKLVFNSVSSNYNNN